MIHPRLSPTLLQLALACVFLTPGMADAKVQLSNIFQSGMVFQQGKPIKIWGTAAPGEHIRLALADKRKSTTADKRGRWLVAMPARQATRKGRSLTLSIQGSNRIVLRDILIGEVWLCSGQSNMVWPVYNTPHGKATLARLTKSKGHKGIRLFRLGPHIPRQPSRQIKGRWVRATTAHVRWFSAVCYYFGAQLQRERRVPVGLIASAWGGTRIESWMPRKILSISAPMVLKQQKRWEAFVRPLHKRVRAFRMKKWRANARKAKKLKKAIPRKPRFRRLRDPWHANSPSALYNGMIYPLHPFAFRGVLWYQGESNVGSAKTYNKLFPLMIERWRALWGAQFPFLYVQIAPFRYGGRSTTDYNKLCEAQMLALRKTIRTAMVVTNDLGNPRDIHPRRKREVAKRLYLAAKALAYGDRKVVFSGPIYKSMQIEKNKISLSFTNVGGGLMARGGKLTQFTIAGKDRRFYPAKAFIVGDFVMVWSKRVPKPVAVRFAWSDTAVHNLYNKQGLPASSFRTDRWSPIRQAIRIRPRKGLRLRPGKKLLLRPKKTLQLRR